MSSTSRRNAAVIACLLLLASLASADWTQLNSGVDGPLYSVHFPEGTQVGYAVGVLPEGGGAILKTTDGGDNWTPQVSGVPSPLNSVYFKDNNNGYAVGDAGTALRTTDGGATWIPMTVPGSGALNYVAFPENSMTGYIGVYPRASAGKILKTTDGGDNWTAITVGGLLNWSRSCGMATDSIGVVVGNYGFVIGITDTAVQDPQTIADLFAAAFSPTDPNKGYLIGNDSTQGVIRYTATGGEDPWDSVTVTDPVVTAIYGVDMPTSDVAYFCGTDGYIGKTLSPTYVRRTDAPSGVTVTLRGLCFPNGADTGFVVGAQGVILRTYDGGSAGWVAEDKAAAGSRATVRVVPNPSRHGIAYHADAAGSIVVFDAVGRAVVRQAATKGMNFLPLPKAGVYMVKVETDGFSTTQKLVVEH